MRALWPLVLSACFGAGCSETAEDLINEGDALVFSRHYSDAAKRYEAAVLEAGDAKDPDAAEQRLLALLKLGEVRHLFLADVQGALRAYRSVVEQDPSSPRAFEARLARVRLFRDRLHDEAAAIGELAPLLDAFADHPDAPQLRLELAQLAFRAGKLRLARQHARKLLEGASAEPRQEAALLLGSIHQLEGRHADALALYEGLLTTTLDDETAARVRLESGHCLEALGRFEEAIAAYERAQDGALHREIIDARVNRVKARLALARSGKPARLSTSIRH